MAASSTTSHARVADLAAGLAVAWMAGAATWRLAGLPASYPLAFSGLYSVMAAIVWAQLPRGAPGPGIGAANRVTLGRAALATPVIAMPLIPSTLDAGAYWWIIVVSTLVLVLDGLDGKVARRTGTETSFGARFDMEVDAALLLGLSALVWQSGKVGPWVLLIGALRYLFVIAGWVWPALTAELPPSQRRRVVCVVQGVVLLVALGPIIPASAAVLVTAGGLAALVYSFGVDVRWAWAANTSSL
ncbi:MAG: CDP-alcohol phosphatidyltransferase family protein [Gemmatimonadota bacterium]